MPIPFNVLEELQRLFVTGWSRNYRGFGHEAA
jgi:hypothetical protein